LVPLAFSFQIHYNTIKDYWNINELASKLVQKEARLKQQEHHSVHLVSQGAKKKWKKLKMEKGKAA
jgi:tryptophan 2,3-dioxygenase